MVQLEQGHSVVNKVCDYLTWKRDKDAACDEVEKARKRMQEAKKQFDEATAKMERYVEEEQMKKALLNDVPRDSPRASPGLEDVDAVKFVDKHMYRVESFRKERDAMISAMSGDLEHNRCLVAKDIIVTIRDYDDYRTNTKEKRKPFPDAKKYVFLEYIKSRDGTWAISAMDFDKNKEGKKNVRIEEPVMLFDDIVRTLVENESKLHHPVSNAEPQKKKARKVHNE
jgi:hypothetical protein